VSDLVVVAASVLADALSGDGTTADAARRAIRADAGPPPSI
jgi:hypothetical protein